jgi:Flp pilus assembly protein TadB
VSGIKQAVVLGAMPIIIGIIYFALQQLSGNDLVSDAGGALLLVALGMAMGFGMLVILRGARDL